MEVTILQHQEGVEVKIQGRLDTVTAPKLEQMVADEVVKSQEVVFECSQMEYISSSGLRVILSAHKRLLGVGGRLVVRNLNSEVRSVFDLTGFSSLLKLE